MKRAVLTELQWITSRNCSVCWWVEVGFWFWELWVESLITRQPVISQQSFLTRRHPVSLCAFNVFSLRLYIFWQTWRRVWCRHCFNIWLIRSLTRRWWRMKETFSPSAAGPVWALYLCIGLFFSMSFKISNLILRHQSFTPIDTQKQNDYLSFAVLRL